MEASSIDQQPYFCVDLFPDYIGWLQRNQPGLPVVFFAQVQAVLLCGVLGSDGVAVRWLLLHLNQIELAGWSQLPVP